MVKIEELSFGYKKESPIFRNFSWKIAHGERWSVIGPSGCGKTTLLYLLAGLQLPTEGKISIDNNHGNGRKTLTGLILQDYGLLPWATAAENVSLGLRIQGKDKKTVSEITQKWLSELGIESVSTHYPSELSGGQRQRVAIARTLCLEPGLLLMDEPFASLDALTREDLLDLGLRLWKNLSSTMLMVTHNIDEAVYWGSRILVLGRAPNSSSIVVENPLSGSAEYRNTPEFNAMCRELRRLVEENAHNGQLSGAKLK
jgi:ABC-type nitrate/sulfonate/bicarbonate transport system ATPase subunit